VVIYEAFVEGKLEAPKHLARSTMKNACEPMPQPATLIFVDLNPQLRCVPLSPSVWLFPETAISKKQMFVAN
jgi:hypothetical protein